MKLYEINQQLLSCIDEETGEILDFELLEQLQLDKEEKIHNIALLLKQWAIDVKAIANEITWLNNRKKTLNNSIEFLKSYLLANTDGKKIEYSNAVISFRKSQKVELDENFVEWAKLNRPDLLKFSEPSANKTAIKDELKSGVLPHATLTENKTVSVK